MNAEHPRLHVTAGSYPGLLSLDELRQGVTAGPGRELWCTLQGEVERRAALPPYDPGTPLPGRQAGAAERHENDYPLSEAALQRVTDAALALADRRALRVPRRRAAAARMDVRSGFLAGVAPPGECRARRVRRPPHRLAPAPALESPTTGSFRPLRPDQRGWLLAGVRERALQPVLDSRTRDAHWGNYNNWPGVIAAGMGTAGLAMEDEIDEAGELIEAAIAYQRTYLNTLGPDGEFNESPGYARVGAHGDPLLRGAALPPGTGCCRRRSGPGRGAARTGRPVRPLVRLPRDTAARHRAVRGLQSRRGGRTRCRSG